MRKLAMLWILLVAPAMALTNFRPTAANEAVQLSAAQQVQYEHCLGEIERLEREVVALSATPLKPEPAINVYARQRGPIRLAASSVSKCHKSFSRGLTHEQRAAMKETLTKLNRCWSAIQRHFVTLDDDLRQHSLDNGRLILHIQGLERFVDEYFESYRSLNADTATPPGPSCDARRSPMVGRSSMPRLVLGEAQLKCIVKFSLAYSTTSPAPTAHYGAPYGTLVESAS